MKDVLFSLKNRLIQKNYNRRNLDIRATLRRYGSVLFFLIMLVLGLTAGCLMYGRITPAALRRLDFLFTTNLPARLSGGVAGAFCAGFASDFMFFAAAFLLGLSLWGIAFLPFVAFFKGFGIGITAGYLLSGYGFSGAVFYVVILLPGIILFSLALVYQLASAYNIFKRLVSGVFRTGGYSFRDSLRFYLRRSLLYLLVTLGAAVVDAVLWCVFAGLFNFK